LGFDGYQRQLLTPGLKAFNLGEHQRFYCGYAAPLFILGSYRQKGIALKQGTN
jgi:hypothetical protein